LKKKSSSEKKGEERKEERKEVKKEAERKFALSLNEVMVEKGKLSFNDLHHITTC
jgi:hypothetical protein